MEQILALVAGLASNLVEALPVGYAFGSGMLATVNPCGFALLPAYISLYLGDTGASTISGGGLASRLLKGLLVTVMVTLGFILLFGVAGGIITAGGRFLVGVMPWAGLGIGIMLVALGAWMLLGRGHLYLGAASRVSALINPGGGRGALGFFMFGIAYGIASLSCTLPIFLIVVGSSLTSASLAAGLGQFLSYSLGMGAMLLALTLGTAVFKEAAGRHMRKMVPYVERISAVLMVLAGFFVIYYWLSIGGLAQRIAQWL
ncbi:MAG: cytochrome c biogenesis protein CcdA [SAR202 cluster bacterium]|nr:cytochrome c biogenesis protein CcdA [SAR202 cluster bacterium]